MQGKIIRSASLSLSLWMFVAYVVAQDIPVDTSYTVKGTYWKLAKEYPAIRIADVKSEDITVIADIVYHTLDDTPFGKRSLHLDLYRPKSKSTLPAIVLIHGGGWRAGNKSLNIEMAEALASRGFAVVSVEYRLSLEAKYPAAVNDVISAIRWVRRNAKQYNIDETKIALAGYSAGGQLASLVGVTYGNTKFENYADDASVPRNVQAVIDLDGLLDFTHAETIAATRKKNSADVLWLGGTYDEIPDRWKEASALTWADKDAPPFLFINSSQTRFHAGYQDMVTKLDSFGVYNEVKKLDNAPHSYWFFHPWFDPMIETMTAFLKKVFAKEKTVAFPGADGFGKYTGGGRGGDVYVVTNLSDDGPGSFREAVKKKGARTIVFAVSGNIALKSSININSGDLTIAGQSAPGDGICIRNYPVTINADNIIIRFMRFRLGDKSGIESDAISGNKGNENIILDHCSISWATDECASFYRNRNFTMQWCIISESLNRSVHSKGDHGYGGIWGGVGASFHHNLLAHHTSRLPRFSGSSTTPNSPEELVDFRNNVIYNWASNSTYGGERGRYNVVNNYYKPGPATKKKNPWMINPSSPYGKFFLTGNVLHNNAVATRDNWAGVKADHMDSVRATAMFKAEPMNDHEANKAFDLVTKHAGASLHRDETDKRIAREVCDGTATFGKLKDGIIDSQEDVGGWPPLKSLKANKDTDSDGIPDQWENKRKLNANDPADAKLKAMGSPFTNLEMYLNEIVEDIPQ
jgi:acetyl esterase/lipase